MASEPTSRCPLCGDVLGLQHRVIHSEGRRERSDDRYICRNPACPREVVRADEAWVKVVRVS